MSLVLRRRGPALAHVAPGVDTLAVRVPDHPAAQELLRRLGPLVMTSANRHGEPDPGTDTEVLAGLDDAEPPGDLPVVRGAVPGVPSTLVDATGSRPRILREGVIPSAAVASAWP